MNEAVTSFEPVADSSARILILGSMPGALSLSTGQYYAQPRNKFWGLMSELIGLDPTVPYSKRLQALIESGIALWDVLYSCKREGSLDSAIEANSIVPNDFTTFFREHPCISVVCFNGAKAERLYNKHVLPTLEKTSITRLRLPSTSSANTLSFQNKVAEWRAELYAQQSLRAGLSKSKLRLLPVSPSS